MSRITLDIELIDDVVLPRNIATSGTADTHDFIPGSVLLGVFAGRCYRQADQFSGDGAPYEALGDLFQSGRVRFQDALPLDDKDMPCVPMPLSIHRPKAIVGNAKAGYDLSVEARPDGIQLTQMRSGYLAQLCADGNAVDARTRYFQSDVLQPSTSYMMRTAINEKTGRAREAQLFGYASLAAGQKFRCAIDFDDNEKLRKHVDTMLGLLFGKADVARIRVGRSKNAEYGRARISRSEARTLESQATGRSSCRLLLLSDLAAFDQFGQPTFAPTPQDLGLSDGVTFDDAKCFVRFRSYAPYNAALGKREPERHVIERGSVLTVHGVTDSDYELISSGLGAYRQQGSGQVLVFDDETPLINSASADRQENQIEQGAAAVLAAVAVQDGVDQQADVTFLAWLGQLAGAHRTVDIELIDNLVTQWSGAYLSARTIFGASDDDFIGPTRRQWALIRSEARENPDLDHLRQVLFDAGNAICGERDTDWSLKTALKAGPEGSGAMLRMRDILRQQFDKLAEQKNPADHLVALCAEIERAIEQGGFGQRTKQASGEEVLP